MVLMKTWLWSIGSWTENAPEVHVEADSDVIAKYVARCDSAMASIVLFVNPTLLYVLGDQDDLIVVWKNLLD